MIRQQLIKETLENLGVINEEQLKEALTLQRESQLALSEIFVKLGYITSENLGPILISQIGIIPSTLDKIEISPSALDTIPASFAKRHRLIPLDLELGKLICATDNIFNFLAQENLELFLQKDMSLVLVSEHDIREALEKYYGSKKDDLRTIIQEIDESEISKSSEATLTPEDEAPVVRLVSLIIQEAARNRASDIHLEPFKDKFRIRYRIDGLLTEVQAPPKTLKNTVISRLKIMSNLDIAEKRLPQDGRIKIKVEDRELDLRVSVLPSLYGESMVLRILDRAILHIHELGFSKRNIEIFERLIKLPNGVMLVTGPTGSGKTTTLYAALSHINTSDKKLITIEDPVEYQLQGINQIQIKPQVGLTFASGLRSMLRQAPDILMVGEIRDFETAQIAIQAALTGHLIFSTLHTNDAPGAITRLIDMNIKPYLVASTLQAVLAQRLVRILCKECKEPHKPAKDEMTALGLSSHEILGMMFYRGRGCAKCNHTGYRGRIGIFELLVLNDEIRILITTKTPSNIIRERAQHFGFKSLREDGIEKIKNGITTIQEVIRITQPVVV
ncbi:MAG: type II secretion system ATPase GspE [Candidatus Omnitrophota bacterium]